MLKEACLVAFVAIDVGKRVIDGRRKRRARKAQAQLAQQRALRAPLTYAPAAAVKPREAGILLRQQLFPYMGIQAVLVATILSGTNIYYPDAWLAVAAVCSAVLCAELGYVVVMQRVLQRRAARIVSLSASAVSAPTASASVRLLNGVWIKVKAASDSMEAAMNLMCLNGLIRRAITLVKGVDLRVSPDSFEMAVTSLVPGFKIWERYPMSGEVRRHRRRDLRRGGAEGRVSVTAEGTLRLDLSWGDPHGGRGHDLFLLPDLNTLVVRSTIQLGGEAVVYSIVYHRRM